MNTRSLFDLRVDLAEPLDLGHTPVGHRRVVNIVGGEFSGERLSGIVLPGGADWQIVRPDGVAVLDARYTLRTRDGALVQVTSQGLRRGPPEVMARLARGEDVDPAEYYFRTAMRFETGAHGLAFLNTILALSFGRRAANAVHLRVEELL
ncbi:MAG: DUF3237 domain-containing protein [Burkholderiales bacterium]|jgi:hypothetical protein|nr:DUF3237 domain-containing protein [Burkholderiales bacterium]